jgi:hypothetical protein
VTQPIDIAYVEVVARTRDLRREIKDITENDVKKLEKSFDDATKSIDKELEHTAAVADKSFRSISDDSKTSAHRVEDSFDNVFNKIDDHFRRTSSRIHDVFDGIDEDGHNAERRLRNRFFIPVENGLRRLGNIAGDVGRGLGQLFSSLGGLASGHPFAALIIALIPPIIALVAALKDLFGVVALLPAGIAVLAATIIPAVVAFQNFGDALSALASGDVEKINEAMKKLAPSARQVAVEMAALIPILKDIQIQVQQGFFQPLIGQFSALAKVLATPLKNGMTTVASALGNLVAKLLKFLGSAQNVNMINKVFASTGRIINALADPLVRFLEAMSNSVVAALPFVERLGAAFGRFLDKFARFINEGIESGAFDKFIEDAFTITKELLQLGKALFGFLGTLFAGTEESGHDLIKSLTDLTNKLNDFLNSAEGQRTLRELVFLVKLFASSLEALLLLFISSQQVFSQFIDFLHLIGVAVTELAINHFGMLIHAAAAAFGWIPGLGPKLRQASDDFDSWAEDILRQINKINGKTITITLKTVASAVAVGALGGAVPHLAEGGLVKARSGGILANIGEGREDEIVSPLSTIKSMIAEVAGGVSFGPGAIVINFGSQLPTLSEARGIGQQIGRGIMSIIDRTDVQATAKAMF